MIDADQKTAPPRRPPRVGSRVFRHAGSPLAACFGSLPGGGESGLGALIQYRAHGGEHGAEHVWREGAGVGVLARTVVAVEKLQAADCMTGARAERVGRAPG